MATTRPMCLADADAVARLTTELGYPSTGRDIRRRFAHLSKVAGNMVLVAVADGEVVGWIHVARTPTLEASDVAHIGGLVVADAWRSSGIGAQLVAAAEAWARDRGARDIVVRSRSSRERAHRFYQRLGYVETKRSHVFAKPLV